MILVRWLARTWSALSAPPPAPLPGPRVLPSYARMGRYIAGGAALDPRIELPDGQVAAGAARGRACAQQRLPPSRPPVPPVAARAPRQPYAASADYCAAARHAP